MTWPDLTSFVVRSLAMLVACSAPLHAAPPADLDRQLAREPAAVTTQTGRTVRGLLDGYRDGRLHLKLATDGGEVGYSFTRDEIIRIELPGAELEDEALGLLDRGEIAQAMPLLEALGRQRIRYIPVLDDAHQRVLWALAAHAADASDPHTVGGIVRATAPLAKTPARELAVAEAELEIALKVGTPAECRSLAERWCSLADPAGRSALGWQILAQLAYEAGDYERARWIALQPVAFSGHLSMRGLAHCYAIAIASAERQGDGTHVQILRRDMETRGLAWPPGFTLAPRSTGGPDVPSRSDTRSRATAPASFEDTLKLPPSR